MIKDSRDVVIGGLENSLQVHYCHRDFHSAFMVLLDLGRVGGRWRGDGVG